MPKGGGEVAEEEFGVGVDGIALGICEVGGAGVVRAVRGCVVGCVVVVVVKAGGGRVRGAWGGRGGEVGGANGMQVDGERGDVRSLQKRGRLGLEAWSLKRERRGLKTGLRLGKR